jgi:hypothetical protein
MALVMPTQASGMESPRLIRRLQQEVEKGLAHPKTGTKKKVSLVKRRDEPGACRDLPENPALRAQPAHAVEGRRDHHLDHVRAP